MVTTPVADGAEKTAEQVGDDALVKIRQALRDIRGNMDKLKTERKAAEAAKLHEAVAKAKSELLAQVAVLEKQGGAEVVLVSVGGKG